MKSGFAIRSAAVVLLLALWPAECAYAELRLPAVFSDNMLLQRDQANPIWGWGNPGERIDVEVAEQTVSAVVQADSNWRVALPKLPVQSDPVEIRVETSSGAQRVIHNVLVGDVWLCTGPSNIYWPVSRCDNAEQEVANAKFPEIRFFTVKRNTADQPQRDCTGQWVACSPQTVGAVSGVGYFFARRIHQQMDVPVGMLQSFWGGSRIEAWTSKPALKAQPNLEPILQWWEKALADMDNDSARKSRHRPACLYNAMIAPLIPYRIRGVISYQGLGNLFWAQYSEELLATMIRDWRARWQQGAIPFGMVQPAPYPCDRWPQQQEDAYSLQREAQLLIQHKIPHTGVAPTTDIGDLKELHFTNKQTVGHRMAQWALATVYGRDVPFAGPVYQSMEIESNKVRIRFSHTGQGLQTRDGKSPTHFTIAGSDGTYYPATAVIDGHTVLVHSPRVQMPAAVRFAWSDTAIPNLTNSDGLPASLFRTN